jgi:hypothetical protein
MQVAPKFFGEPEVRRPMTPSPNPAMNVDRTMEAKAVVTPKLAIARRSQTTSYTRLQKPDTTKKMKYHRSLGKRDLQKYKSVVAAWIEARWHCSRAPRYRDSQTRSISLPQSTSSVVSGHGFQPCRQRAIGGSVAWLKAMP